MCKRHGTKDAKRLLKWYLATPKMKSTTITIQITLLLLAFFTAKGINITPDNGPWAQHIAIKEQLVKPVPPSFLQDAKAAQTQEVDPIDTLTLKEKIGQLFMVSAYSNRDAVHEAALSIAVEEYHIGGLIFFQGGPGRQQQMFERLSAKAKIPLLVGMDAEWGLNMRLDSISGFQRQMTLGATLDPALVQDVGAEIGRQCRELGVHINFAPVCDINSNANNPVINSRSFGEDRFWVGKLSTAFARGLEREGVMACAKHFPGHGDTDSDSHKTLPTVNHSLARLDSLELYPFKKLFEYGIGSVMVAHLNVPAMKTDGQPATLVPNVVHNWLKDSLGFEGLVFTDALNMRGVADQFPPGTTDLMALQAGADVLLFPMDVPKAVETIVEAVRSGKLKEERINEACAKILKAKKHFIQKDAPAPFNSQAAELRMRQLRKKVAQASVTLVKNEGDILPLDPLKSSPVAIALDKDAAIVNQAIRRVAQVKAYSVDGLISPEISRALSQQKTVVVSATGSVYKRSNNYGLDAATLENLQAIANDHNVVFCWYGNPYALKAIPNKLWQQLDAVVLGYQSMVDQYAAGAEAVFGEIPFKGKLPVSINKYLPVGLGLSTGAQSLLESVKPEWVGMSSAKLAEIDRYMEAQIADKATPGCRILVLRNGKAVYNRSFGHYTYAKKVPVNENTVYDLASLTKVLSSALATMRLSERGVLDINKTLGDYLNYIPEESPYHNLVLKDIMMHQARLPGWIPFFKEFLENDSLAEMYVSKNQTADFPVEVCPGYYTKPELKDWMWNRILQEPLRSKTEYHYSDIGFYFLKEIIEAKVNMSLDRYVSSTFYQPMGLTAMGYLPLRRMRPEAIAPTEYDIAWRGTLIQGYVHDQGAALLGGVGGHAGLFSNAADVAAIMQMLLEGGVFKGKRYLDEQTVAYFTTSHASDVNENRRGIIFDKPVRDGGPGPTFDGVSFDSFGHSGFTGTLTWADPTEDLVYVFLSNRVYPSSENKKLIRNNVRSNIQKMIYEAIEKPNEARLK